MKLKRLGTKQFLIIMLIISICFCLAFLAREYFANILVGYIMEEIEIPGANDRVLIFAPHSDDEALGAADLIKKSIENNAKVKVVIATNGDGFTRAVAIEAINAVPKAIDYINYGYARQVESLQALKLIGLNEEDIVFLGYPDRGISSIWSAHWMNSNPYLSSYTKVNQSPYNNNFSDEVIYSGESLYKDILKVIDEFRPTHIVFPHPNDRHPDHWGLSAFIKYSLEFTDYAPEHEWLYLVHRGSWPTPLKRNRSMFLVPPMSLYNTGTKWLSLNMTEEDIVDKSNVFKLYKSQVKRIGILMSAFERKNELFGEYGNAVLLKDANYDSEIEANEDNKIIEDPRRDAITLETNKPSDIAELHVEISKENNLHVFISLTKKPDRLTSYHLNMIFFDDDRATPLNLVVKNASLRIKNYRDSSINNIDGIDTIQKGKLIHIKIPNDKISEYNSIFINAESSFGSYYMDRTAWRMVDNITGIDEQFKE